MPYSSIITWWCFGAGTFWTSTSHIITAVIGSGVLSLAWAIAQLGWVAGPTVLALFAIVNLYTSNLLAMCYRAGDPVTGQRNYTYMDAVKANLGKGGKFLMLLSTRKKNRIKKQTRKENKPFCL